MPNNLNSSKSKIVEKLAAVWCIKALLLTLLAFLIISLVILSCVPPVSKDALVHHLAVPKLYLKHGGMYEIPFMPFSYYPMNLDLLYLIPLYFGNDIVPKFIHFSFALLTAWLIFNYLRRRINAIYALLGIIFFLSIPVIVKLSITVYVDLGLIFFSTASLFLLLKWIENHFRLKFLIASAIFCGLSMGTKYNGLVTFFLLTLFVPFLYSRYTEGGKTSFFKAAGYGIVFLFVALLFFSPWMIRNYGWTNNPIFPLYNHWFNPQNTINRQTVNLFTYRSLIYHESWWEIALLPIRIFFQGQDGNPQYFDGRLNPFLFFLPFFAFYGIKRDPAISRNEKKIMIAYVVLFLAFAFFSSGLRIRYISPIIPPLVILSMFGVRKMVEEVRKILPQSLGKIGLAVIMFALFFSLWLNADYLFGQYKYVDPLGYLDGTLTRNEYIDKYRLEFPTIRYINENLPEDTRILFLFMGKRGYYCNREYVFDMNNNASMLRQLVRSSKSSHKVLLGLKHMDITPLIIHNKSFEKWIKSNFSQKDQEVISPKKIKRY
ncbi:MAG: glycosyltransferase family 39 protein [Deltaproteobacteria bacterium]|nr:glycosyltransferase family 39 protein [Deltaproteobacteria bacterium]